MSVLHRGGAQAGTSTLLIFFREPQIGVAVISNRDRSDGLRDLAIELATAANRQPVRSKVINRRRI